MKRWWEMGSRGRRGGGLCVAGVCIAEVVLYIVVLDLSSAEELCLLLFSLVLLVELIYGSSIWGRFDGENREWSWVGGVVG